MTFFIYSCFFSAFFAAGQTPQPISVPVRTLEDCLTEELRRMDPDEVYADVINKGWDLISH